MKGINWPDYPDLKTCPVEDDLFCYVLEKAHVILFDLQISPVEYDLIDCN